MPNIWYLIHQTPKTYVHKIFQISKFLHAAIVHAQVWDGTDKNAKVFILILFTFSLTSQHISLSSSGSLNSHLCLALSIALSQPRWSHHSDHHAVPSSFMPSTMPRHAASPSLPYHPPCHATPRHLACHAIHHATSHRRACRAIHPLCYRSLTVWDMSFLLFSSGFFFFFVWVLLLWLLIDFHGWWWWLFLLLPVGCEV